MRGTEYQQELVSVPQRSNKKKTMACVTDGRTTYDQAQSLEPLK